MVFYTGDRVHIDIPDESDPDHSVFHGKHGVVTEVIGMMQGVKQVMNEMMRAFSWSLIKRVCNPCISGGETSDHLLIDGSLCSSEDIV